MNHREQTTPVENIFKYLQQSINSSDQQWSCLSHSHMHLGCQLHQTVRYTCKPHLRKHSKVIDFSAYSPSWEGKSSSRNMLIRECKNYVKTYGETWKCIPEEKLICYLFISVSDLLLKKDFLINLWKLPSQRLLKNKNCNVRSTSYFVISTIIWILFIPFQEAQFSYLLIPRLLQSSNLFASAHVRLIN